MTGYTLLGGTAGGSTSSSLILNARDHGMVGDGVTNDQPAFAALVATLGAAYVADGKPRVIYCPPGTYAIRNSGTVWKSGVSLIGAGPGITRFALSNPGAPTNPTPLAAYTTAFHGASPSTPLVDCTFADFEVDGSGVTISPYTTGPKALVLQYMLRATFRNLYLHDCGATALGCDFLQDSLIDGVVAVGNGRLNNGTQAGGAGIGIGIGGWGPSERTTISNCTAINNGTHGIFVELQDSSFPPPRGIRITGCHVEGNTHGISDWGADGLVVTGCTIINNRDGFHVSGSGVADIAGRGGLVTGCLIDGNITDGVRIGDTPGGYTVRSNRISNNGGHGIRLANTLQNAAYAGSANTVTDNDVYGNALDGVHIGSVNTDAYVSGNRVRSNGVQAGGADSGSGGPVTYTALTLTDTGKAWAVNAQQGKTVTVGGQTAVVRSNTATVLTLHPWRPGVVTAWATGTPSAGAAYTLPAAPAVRAGLTFDAAVNSATLRNNRVWDNQSSKTQTHGWQITASGSCGSGRVEGNDLLGNLTGAHSFAVTPSGGYWSHNPGLPAGVPSSPSTIVIDGAELVSGQLRYKGAVRNWVSAGLSPSASANTAGAAQTCTPSSGQQGFAAFMLVSIVFAGTFNAETATATITVTFSDATTGSATVTATATGRQNLAASGFVSVTKDGAYVTQVAVTLQSTITSSAVTATANVVALQN